MKRPLLILALMLLMEGLLLSHAQADEFGLEHFLNAVQEGKVETVMKSMHPQLAERIDPPILEAWLQAVAFRLGRVEVITPVTDVYEQNRQISTAEIVFTKGTAQAELAFVNGAIVSFEVTSDRLTNWFQRPTSLQIYRKQAETLLKSLLKSDFTAARKVLHEKIAQQLTDQYLQTTLKTIEQQAGSKPEVTYQNARLTVLPDERLRQIDLVFDITGETGTLTAELAIRFHGMQGHIVGLRLLE